MKWFNVFKFGTPILVLILLYYWDYYTSNQTLESKINGRIDDIHIEAKGYIDFYIKGEKHYTFISNISNPNIIEVGDSVYKPSGTLTLKIIKQNGNTIYKNMYDK